MPSPAQAKKKQKTALFERIQDAGYEFAGGTFPDDLAGLRRDVAILAPAELAEQLQLIKAGIPAAAWETIAPEIAAFIKSAGLPVPEILSTEKLGPQTPAIDPQTALDILGDMNASRNAALDVAAPALDVAAAPCLFCGRQGCDTIFVPGIIPGFEHVGADGIRMLGPSASCLEAMRKR